jgi:hypothetical protein
VDQQVLEHRPGLQAGPPRHAPPGDVHLERPERGRRDVGVRGGWCGRRLGFGLGLGLRLGLKGRSLELGRRGRLRSWYGVPHATSAAPEDVQELAGQAPVLVREKDVGPLVDFPLGEAAAAGGRLEIDGDALVLGAAAPELAHGIHAEAGPVRRGAEIGQRTLELGRERVPGELAQF